MTATSPDPGVATTIGEALARVVAARPDDLALDHAGQRLSYADLAARMSPVAGALGSGAAPVALTLPAGIDQVATAFGVLASGRGYLALDADAPAPRIATMLALAGAELVVSPDGEDPRVPSGIPQFPVGRFQEVIPLGRVPTPGTARLDSLAYVAFTSGTTGEPKGVAVTHRGVLGLVEALRFEIGLGPKDRVLSFAPLAFDASTFEVFGALLTGASLHVPPVSTFRDPGELGGFVARAGVTVAWLTAGLFHQLVSEDARTLAGLRVLVVGGDVVNPDAAREVLEHASGGLTVVNGYGPTENTTFSTTFRTSRPEDVGDFPIGSALPGRSALVLDDRMREVAPSEEGELYVGGNGLARGYLARPGLTAARFVAHPNAPGLRLYRTGDRAVRSADGVVEFRGRRDRQVKLRGYRIEVAEVEAVLAAADGINDVAVVKNSGEDRLERLVAHVAVGDAEVALLELRRQARATLPAYALPAVIVVHPELPLTPQGKVDLRALEEVPVFARPRMGVVYEAPLPGAETEIAALWEDHLRIQPVGRNDDFFELGGYSLAGMRISVELQRSARARITPYEFYSSPTVASLARLLEEKEQRYAPDC